MEPVGFRWTRQRKVGADAPHLIVYLDGIQDTNQRPGTVITKRLLDYDDIDVVSVFYPRPFSVSQVIDTVCEAIRGYRRVTFIGTSMGTLLVHDIIKVLKLTRRLPRRVGFILLDGPTGKIDLVDKNARFVPYLPPIWTPKRLDKLIFNDDEPPHEAMEPKAEAEWREHLARSHSFPFREFLRQTKYIVRHRGPIHAVMYDVPAVFVQSKNDKIVKPAAYEHWAACFSYTLPLITIDTPNHADLGEFASVWGDALIEALVILDRS